MPANLDGWWTIRFHLRDAFSALSLAAILLWLWLWPMWDQRERSYLVIWEIAFWLGVIYSAGKGVIRRLWMIPVLGTLMGCAAAIDVSYYNSVPPPVHDVHILYLGLCLLVSIGGISLLGLAAIYSDQLTGCFQRFPWLRFSNQRRFKRYLASTCLACAILGVLLNEFWTYSSSASQGTLVALLSLSFAGAVAGAGGTIVLALLGVGTKWIAAFWSRRGRARWQLAATIVGSIFLVLTIAVLGYHLIRPHDWRTRKMAGATDVALSPDGTWFAVSNQLGRTGPVVLGVQPGTIRIFDWRTLSPIATHTMQRSFGAVHFLDNGRTLFYAESSASKPFHAGDIANVVVADSATGHRIREVPFPRGRFRYLQFNSRADECWAVISQSDGRNTTDIVVWRTTDWEQTRTITLDLDLDRTRSDLSPDSAQLVAFNGWLNKTGNQLWNLATQTFEKTLRVPDFVAYGRISPDGKWLLANHFLWDLENGRRFQPPNDPVQFSQFAPDGRSAIAWETMQWPVFQGLESVRHVPFFRHIPQLGANRLLVFDVSSQRLKTKSPWIIGRGEIEAVSQNGSRVIVSYYDEYLRQYYTILWDHSKNERSG